MKILHKSVKSESFHKIHQLYAKRGKSKNRTSLLSESSVFYIEVGSGVYSIAFFKHCFTTFDCINLIMRYLDIFRFGKIGILFAPKSNCLPYTARSYVSYYIKDFVTGKYRLH